MIGFALVAVYALGFLTPFALGVYLIRKAFKG